MNRTFYDLAAPALAQAGVPLSGLPGIWQAVFVVALLIVLLLLGWSTALYVRAARWTAGEDRYTDDPAGPGTDDYLWVFVVPALNEAQTIHDSVTHLLEVPVAHRRIIVVDDASDDATPAALAAVTHPDLRVIRREPPEARRGKAAALNHAYATLDLDTTDRSRVVMAVIDADARLAPEAAEVVGRHLADPSVGGVQSLVRIYNRNRPLTWFQDLEFAVYGRLFQAGRNFVGTAGMGGNGQFNRLSALDDIAEDGQPWRRDRLTEDQDLGLRLVARGWRIRQDLRATVGQQGPPRLGALLRQRTRWAQGNLQAIGLTGALARAPFPRTARAELMIYLWMPVLQSIVGLSLIAAVVLAVLGVVPLWDGGPTWQLAVIYLLGFGSTMLGCVAAKRRQGRAGRLVGFLAGHAYAFYTWLLWPVLVRAFARQLQGRLDWAKTQHEAVGAPVPGGARG